MKKHSIYVVVTLFLFFAPITAASSSTNCHNQFNTALNQATNLYQDNLAGCLTPKCRTEVEAIYQDTVIMLLDELCDCDIVWC